MAKRPWVTPDEVREYSDKATIAARSDAKLKVDIMRAELYIISYTKNRFEDDSKYPEIPESVKTAVVLVAEVYGDSAVVGRDKGFYKSETHDDYSYTAADTMSKLENLDLGPLLDEFINPEPRNGVTMKLRKL